MAEENLTAGSMPVGQNIYPEIRPNQVRTFEGGIEGPEYDDDAMGSLIYYNFGLATNYLETNSWLMDWQETDILYQSPERDRNQRNQQGRPPRISSFIIWRNTNVMRRQLKRALFADQDCFALRARRKRKSNTEKYIDQWMALLRALNKRANFVYNCKLLIDTQVLQGTGIGRPGWETRTYVKWSRKRKNPQPQVTLPVTGLKKLNTAESNEMQMVPRTVTESWPIFENRQLGTTIFDPRWCTPNRPALSCKYAIDVDYVNFRDLQQMRGLSCYKNIPNDETLKRWFIQNAGGDATSPGQIYTAQTSQGSTASHAEGMNRDMNFDPLDRPVMLIEMTTEDSIGAIIEYDGQWLTIRNEKRKTSRGIKHMAANWSNVPNAGYGIGIGRVNTPDQRINGGMVTEALKMVAYPMSAPIMIRRGENGPTQNVITNFGRFWPVDTGPDGDVRKSAMYMPVPEVPADAWKFIAYSQQDSQDLSGANSTFAQGNLGGPGSSAARTATGASRIASMSDANLSDPVDAVAEGVIVPWITYLMEMVKLEMPLEEIQEILSDDFDDEIIKAIDYEQFLDSEFDVEVLAGQKLAAKQGILQMIPFFLQIVQQPQLLEYLHQRGETIEFKAIMDVFLQLSELVGQPDFFRPLTPQEMTTIQSMNPGAQRVQAATAVEEQRGKNKLQEIGAQTQANVTEKAAEVALEHASGSVALERAAGLEERKTDEQALEGGVPGQGLS